MEGSGSSSAASASGSRLSGSNLKAARPLKARRGVSSSGVRGLAARNRQLIRGSAHAKSNASSCAASTALPTGGARAASQSFRHGMEAPGGSQAASGARSRPRGSGGGGEGASKPPRTPSQFKTTSLARAKRQRSTSSKIRAIRDVTHDVQMSQHQADALRDLMLIGDPQAEDAMEEYRRGNRFPLRRLLLTAAGQDAAGYTSKRMDRKISREVETNLSDAFSQAVLVGSEFDQPQTDAILRSTRREGKARVQRNHGHSSNGSDSGSHNTFSFNANPASAHISPIAYNRQRSSLTASDIAGVLDGHGILGTPTFALFDTVISVPACACCCRLYVRCSNSLHYARTSMHR